MSWIKLKRESEKTVTALCKKRPTAYALLTQIAYRARRSDCPVTGLQAGEALIGDWKSYCHSERCYRSDVQLLKKCGFSTFKPTNRGTIAKLTGTAVFDINSIKSDEQSDEQVTSKTEKVTTNKNVKNDKKKRYKEKVKPCKQASLAIEYLNQKAEKGFHASSNNCSLIMSRLKEGYTIEDIKKVIRIKCAQWKGDPKMDKF
jgi:uncharacterized phage protein (TIGR02220 family)